MNNIDLNTILLTSESVLIKIPSEFYNQSVSFLTEKLTNKKVCYITLNKTYNSLKNNFLKDNINTDQMVFIDAITKSMEQVENTEDCYFVSSPQSLTELSIVISEFLKQNIEFFILDSLTTLLIYQKKVDPVIKFVTNIVNTSKKHNSHIVFFILDSQEHQLLIEESSMIMDSVYTITSESFPFTEIN